jgi:hypothetical protein
MAGSVLGSRGGLLFASAEVSAMRINDTVSEEARQHRGYHTPLARALTIQKVLFGGNMDVSQPC